MPAINTIVLHCSGSSSQCDSTLKIKIKRSTMFRKEKKLLSLFVHDMMVIQKTQENN